MNTCCFATAVVHQAETRGVAQSHTDQASESDQTSAIDGTEAAQKQESVKSHKNDCGKDKCEIMIDIITYRINETSNVKNVDV